MFNPEDPFHGEMYSPEDDDGGPNWPLFVIGLIILAVFAGGLIWWLSRWPLI